MVMGLAQMRVGLLAFGVVAGLVAGCGGDDASSSATAPSTTSAAVDHKAAYEELTRPVNCAIQKFSALAAEADKAAGLDAQYAAAQKGSLPAAGELAAAELAFATALRSRLWPSDVAAEMQQLADIRQSESKYFERLSKATSPAEYRRILKESPDLNAAAEISKDVRTKLGLPVTPPTPAC